MSNRAVFKSSTFNVGDTVRVEQKIKEAGKERAQPFEGIVIKIKGALENKSFTVRRIGTGGIGIEKIYPLSLPSLQSIKVLKKGKVRRAKLYYLRKRVGKKATRVKESRHKHPDDQKTKKPGKAGRKPGKKTSSK